jgi:hypothetical protein
MREGKVKRLVVGAHGNAIEIVGVEGLREGSRKHRSAVSPTTTQPGSDAGAAAQHLFHTIGAIKALVLRQRPSSFFSSDDGKGRLFCTGAAVACGANLVVYSLEG